MAEYIDRNLIEWYGCDFEDGNCKNRECSGCSHAECSHSQVMQIPVADVIEREKIDKAIEEMEFHIKCNTNPKTGMVNLLGQGQIMMLDILKRNIGG